MAPCVVCHSHFKVDNASLGLLQSGSIMPIIVCRLEFGGRKDYIVTSSQFSWPRETLKRNTKRNARLLSDTILIHCLHVATMLTNNLFVR